MNTVIKQSLISYSVENKSRKVLGWIKKVKNGYDVVLRDTLMQRDHEPVFQASFKEAKEYALYWSEGGEYDQKHN